MPLPRTRRGVRRENALIILPIKQKVRFPNMPKLLMGNFMASRFYAFLLFVLGKKEVG